MLYICGLCDRKTEDRAAILAHMANAHGITNPTEEPGIELEPLPPTWPGWSDGAGQDLQPSLFELPHEVPHATHAS